MNDGRVIDDRLDEPRMRDDIRKCHDMLKNVMNYLVVSDEKVKTRSRKRFRVDRLIIVIVVAFEDNIFLTLERRLIIMPGVVVVVEQVPQRIKE